MNIKDLNPYKRLFEDLIEVFPISSLEFDIQSSNDPLIKKRYNRLLDAENKILDFRYKKIIHNTGILGIYSLFDVCYGDVIRWILEDPSAKRPDNWRINTVYKEKIERQINDNK